MASGQIYPPGSELGPCTAECKHLDCASKRRQASMSCRLCTLPIGYGKAFLVDPEDLSSDPHAQRALVHEACLNAPFLVPGSS